MGGGLMQLVAYGAQDIYLTGNPQITFFKVVYRRHTNFSMEAIEQTLNGTVAASSSVTSTVSRNGDLIGRVFIQHDPGADINESNYGHALIDYIELEIGGQRIDKHYGHWMEVWAELTEPNPAGTTSVCADNMATAGNFTKFQKMACAGGVKTATADTGMLFIPLQFWFCRNPGLALPLIALQYHEVKIKLAFSAALDTTGSTKLYVDYIYLDTDERRRFAQQSHEYLIEQVQYSNSSSSKSHELNFNHPVKELIWTGPKTWTLGAGAGEISSTVLTAAEQYTLKLNGHDRFSARDRLYFTRAQVWQHHSGFGGLGSTSALDGIAVYSFALKPEEHQPSGTCNFSRIDNARLELANTAQELNVYAVNYNVLRIMSGMGGLAYSN
jgi:hypothetical protein